jgi:antitoxin component YwqK of YwqJK toxin-antitoxin module
MEGVKDGLEKMYYFNGNLMQRKKYKNGNLLLTENFDSSGNKIK